jgi:drug/metabolite transporter (DMT)-like permease
LENLRAGLLMAAAMAGFALEDLFLKQATATLPVGQVLVMLGAGGTLAFALLLARRGFAFLTPLMLTGPVLARNLAEAAASVAIVSALALVPLATFSAILQASPLVMTLGGALFLGERVGWRRWSAVGAGFAGVLLILRPGTPAFAPELLIAVVAVAALAVRDLVTRRIPAQVATLQLAAWGMAATVPAGLVTMLAAGTPPRLAAEGLGFSAMGLGVGVAAYYAITLATRMGEVAVVAPLRYVRLVFALALAVVFLGERPDALTLVGAALVVASGLYTLLREAQLAAGARAAARAGGQEAAAGVARAAGEASPGARRGV